MVAPMDVHELDDAVLEATRDAIEACPYIPQEPTEPQLRFLADPRREVLFGGAAGPGKTSALLMAALMYADTPGYSALILRRTFPDLAQPGGIMDRCIEWITSGPAKAAGARWKAAEKKVIFESGAVIQFGFLKEDRDKYKYQGGEYQLICWDELTQFELKPFLYLSSRLRRSKAAPVPLRIRAASNPGGSGHDWVKAHFGIKDDVDDPVEQDPDRGFIPAKIDDNPHLDREEYVKTLSGLDEVTKQQLLKGNWRVRKPGAMFRREWFEIIDELPPRAFSRPVRYWDLGSTEGDGDWTVGTLLTRDERGHLYVLDVRRGKWAPADVEAEVLHAWRHDGRHTRVRIPIDRGQAGRSQLSHFERNVVPLADFDGLLETGSKWVRAKPVGALAKQQRIHVMRGTWNRAWFDQLEAFAEDPDEYEHDDDVDSLAGAYQVLIEEPTKPWKPSRGSYAPPARDLEGAVEQRRERSVSLEDRVRGHRSRRKRETLY